MDYETEFKQFFEFLDEVVFDSPHSGDDELIGWYLRLSHKAKECVLLTIDKYPEVFDD